MLAILPLASDLNPPEAVAATLGRVADRLARHDVRC